MAKRDALGIDRFTDALYTVAETACYLGEADSTVRSWARGYRRRGRGDVTDASVVRC